MTDEQHNPYPTSEEFAAMSSEQYLAWLDADIKHLKGEQPEPVTPPVATVTKVEPKPEPKLEPRQRAPWEAGYGEPRQVLEALDAVENYPLGEEWQKRHDDAAKRFQSDLDDQEAAEAKRKADNGKVPGWDY